MTSVQALLFGSLQPTSRTSPAAAGAQDQAGASNEEAGGRKDVRKVDQP